MILFDLIVHLGTLVSITVVFWRSLSTLLRTALTETLALLEPQNRPVVLGPFSKLVLMGAITVAITGVLGLMLKRTFEAVFGSPQLLVLTLVTTAVLLFLTDRLGKRPLGVKDIGPRVAVIIGVAQALALIPGISRSGITIIAGLLTGLKRRWAAEYSFLVAIPTILAASLFQAIEVYAGEGIASIGAGPMIAGFITAAISGTVALRLVLVLLFRAQLKVFSAYLLCLATLIGFGVLDGVI